MLLTNGLGFSLIPIESCGSVPKFSMALPLRWFTLRSTGLTGMKKKKKSLVRGVKGEENHANNMSDNGELQQFLKNTKRPLNGFRKIVMNSPLSSSC